MDATHEMMDELYVGMSYEDAGVRNNEIDVTCMRLLELRNAEWEWEEESGWEEESEESESESESSGSEWEVGDTEDEEEETEWGSEDEE